MSRSRSRSPHREDSEQSQAPPLPDSSTQVPWWQKFKPTKPVDDDLLGYGDSSSIPSSLPQSSNPWLLKRPPPPVPTAAPPSAPPSFWDSSEPPLQQSPANKFALLLDVVPGELNNLSRLYDAFKDFGEIVTVVPVPLQAKAFVEYKDQTAVNTALHVLASGSSSNPTTQAFFPCKASLTFSVPAPAARTPPPPPTAAAGVAGPGGGGGGGGGRGQNLVLESEGVRRAREKKEQEQKRLEDKKGVLNKITGEIQNILKKLNEKTTGEKSKEGYRKLLEAVKVKKEKIAKEIETEEMRVFEIQQRKYMEKMKQYEKQNRRYTAELQESLTLDLRPKYVRIDELPEELRNAAVLNEYIRAMGVKEAETVAWLDDSSHNAAILKFRSHAAAEILFKHELAFKAEWVPNDEGDKAQHELELEIFEQDDDQEATAGGDDDDTAAATAAAASAAASAAAAEIGNL